MALLGMYKMRKFGRISQKEDWGVVGDDIPVALLSPELNGEPTRVPRTVVRP